MILLSTGRTSGRWSLHAAYIFEGSVRWDDLFNWYIVGVCRSRKLWCFRLIQLRRSFSNGRQTGDKNSKAPAVLILVPEATNQAVTILFSNPNQSKSIVQLPLQLYSFAACFIIFSLSAGYYVCIRTHSSPDESSGSDPWEQCEPVAASSRSKRGSQVHRRMQKLCHSV